MGRIPEMEVLLAGGVKKPAGELKVGDKVETLHQHTLKKGEHEITYVRVIESPLLSLNLSGESFTCAEEDRFYSTNRKGWLNATDLVKGDKISRLEGEVEFQGSTKLGTGQSVELTVDEAHTYVCSDLLLHNKGGGGGSPPPPPPKRYSQKEFDTELEKRKQKWQTTYDTRLAGQKELWGAQEAARKSAFALEQRDLYDERLKTRRGEWHTAAESKYDRRLGEARTGWHSEAERRYDTRLGTAKTGWEEEEAKRTAATQEAFDKKYGLLQGRYTSQGEDYTKRLQEEQSKFRHENQSRLDLLGRHETLQSRYQKRGQEYAGLENKYAARGREYDTLQGKYQKRGEEYASLQGRYDARGQRYQGLEGQYKDRGQKYNTLQGQHRDLQSRYDARGRDYRQSRPAPAYSQPSTVRTGVSSDAERKALLTGDYGYLATDKEKARGSGSAYLDRYQKRYG